MLFLFLALQKDETSSSLSKIFDPTIYSMQPLQTTTANSVPNDVDTENAASVNSSEESSVSLVHGTDDGLKQSKVIDLGDDHTHFVISRKTSTASECTTMSDYTPENTITSNSTSSPPTISMMHQSQQPQPHMPLRPEVVAFIPTEQRVDGATAPIDQSTPTENEPNLIAHNYQVGFRRYHYAKSLLN